MNKSKQVVAALLGESASLSLEDWINDWCMKVGSAIEIWGHEEQWTEIKKAVESGAKVVAVDSREKADSMVSRGWTLLADEENGDSYDSVLVKRKDTSPMPKRPAKRGDLKEHWGPQKSDQTLDNDARHVLKVLNDAGLSDELLNDHDEAGQRQWLLITMSADEEDALPGFWNLFSNMSREDMEKVADKVLASARGLSERNRPESSEDEPGSLTADQVKLILAHLGITAERVSVDKDDLGLDVADFILPRLLTPREIDAIERAMARVNGEKPRLGQYSSEGSGFPDIPPGKILLQVDLA